MLRLEMVVTSNSPQLTSFEHFKTTFALNTAVWKMSYAFGKTKKLTAGLTARIVRNKGVCEPLRICVGAQ